MSRYHRSNRSDLNQKEIIKTLRKMGLSVVAGHDDILVGYQGKTFWYEIKEPDRISKKTGEVLKNRIRPSQIKLLNEFKGHYRVITSVEQILEDIRHGK